MFEKGSEWRRWDLHVHTPCSLLNNNFGSDWDNYVKVLFTKAIDCGIAAIGITDYFSIEGYKTIKTNYIENPQKMEELFPNLELRQKVSNILLLPNIEVRLNMFISDKSHPVNYHIIFSNEVPVETIESKFLSSLNIPLLTAAGIKRSVKANRSGIEELGHHINSIDKTNKDDYLIGLRSATVELDEILEILHVEQCFKDKHLLCFPSDEDWSTISWIGRDGNTRRNMVQSSHILFASNPRTVDWALGKLQEHKEEYVKEFFRIRPCVKCCDAHSFEELFYDENDRYCWIKADPTFIGLYQILYEPEQRVRISPIEPESKPEYQVISSVRIINENFSEDSILLNDKLVCIIGGKSTGKSLLLHNIAYCIDKNQVNEKSEVTRTSVRPLENIEVTWGDGRVSKPTQQHPSDKIIYIPQSYLNRVSDIQGKRTEVDIMVQNTLRQDTKVKDKFIEQDENIDHQKKIVDQKIYDLLVFQKNLSSINETYGEVGSSKSIGREILKLQEDKDALLKELDVSAATIDEYDFLSKRIIEINRRLSNLVRDHDYFLNEFYFKLVAPDFEKVTTIDHDRISKKLDQINSEVQRQSSEFINDIIKEIEQEIQTLYSEHDAQNLRLAEIEPIVLKSKGLEEIEAKLKHERSKIQQSLAMEERIRDLTCKINQNLEDIASSQSAYHKIRTEFADFVNQHSSVVVEDMEFHLDVVFRCDKFQEFITKFVDNRTISRFTAFEIKPFIADSYNSANLVMMAKSIIQNNTSSLQLKGDIAVENALRELFSNWYEINYVVKMEGDKIEDMSPGKKALVLLELLIGIAESNTPILIDQPEDDLDNRSVFNDLVKYLRRRKQDRQIIIATHNANIVVGGDAEQVIVANQQGTNSPNKLHKFEYRSGSIENDSPILDESGNVIRGVLNSKGIQSHICEILEGGKLAFELRRDKYFHVR